MIKTTIRNGRLFSENGRFRKGLLYMLGDRIVTEEEYRASSAKEEIWNAKGNWIIPGLTDIHFHGCAGYDCSDGTVEAFRALAAYEASQGITSITPATMTLPEETLMQVAAAAAEFAGKKNDDSSAGPETEGADLVGLYMEGPFINPKKKGAQKEEYIRKPDISLFHRLQEASGGLFRTVVVAPEQEGAMEFIREASGEVSISLGHTAADYETACQALENGASQITHLFNAMPDFLHREPGPAGAAADHPSIMVELICDGIHIHPSVVRNVFRLFGPDRVILISDSMRATGLPDGESELGGQKVYKKGKEATLEDGTLAGSVTNLMDCMRTAVLEMGIPLETAIKAAAVNPAKAIGIYGEYGRLTPGSYANVVALDSHMNLRQVFHHGRKV